MPLVTAVSITPPLYLPQLTTILFLQQLLSVSSISETHTITVMLLRLIWWLIISTYTRTSLSIQKFVFFIYIIFNYINSYIYHSNWRRGYMVLILHILTCKRFFVFYNVLYLSSMYFLKQPCFREYFGYIYWPCNTYFTISKFLLYLVGSATVAKLVPLPPSFSWRGGSS